MIGADVSAMKHGAAEGMEIAAHELNAAFIRDAAMLVGAVQVGTAVLGDFQRRGLVFARDVEDEIVEAVGPDLPGEIGERAFMAVEIVNAGGIFP